jgi:hypothetical protein
MTVSFSEKGGHFTNKLFTFCVSTNRTVIEAI